MVTNEQKKAFYKKSRDKLRAERLEKYGYTIQKRDALRWYGCTLEEFSERMGSSSCCQICGKTDSLCYDHCHITNKFRGVLCRSCNKGLGAFGDNYEGVSRALKYLENIDGNK